LAVDIDPTVAVATQRLAGRAAVATADVTPLPRADASLDAVVSLLMLHHVIERERALAEIARVLRPGGVLIGYDLLDTAAARLLHRLDGSAFRLVCSSQFDEVAAQMPLADPLRSHA